MNHLQVFALVWQGTEKRTHGKDNLMAKVDTCKELQKYLALKISSLTIAMNFRHWPYWVSIDNIFSFH